jgi:xanthine dehydrogenase YagS FAD-binding subunit
MINFQYAQASDVADAVRRIAADPTAKFIAGGTNLIDLMKEDVERPTRLIDISRLPLKTIEETADGGVRIGALVPNSDLAYHPLIAQRYPMLANAILAGASAQLRNMRRPAAIFCNARAAITFTTLRPLAISASPAAVAPRSMASTVCMRSSAPVRPALRRILPTCVSRWPRSTPRSM